MIHVDRIPRGLIVIALALTCWCLVVLAGYALMNLVGLFALLRVMG